ncbi:hypothetical protein GW17_00006495 [Ensete ventricosum]|nr:hypothetical protein GW17_00006495 [Ensete ventricosum]
MTRVRSRASTTRSGRKRRDEESKPGVGGVLIELALGGEDDEGDLRVAEDGDLVGLLEQPRPALGEGHLPIDLVLDPLQLHPPPPHLDPSPPLPPPLPSSNSNLGGSVGRLIGEKNTAAEARERERESERERLGRRWGGRQGRFYRNQGGNARTRCRVVIG